MYNQTKHTTNKSVPTPPNLLLALDWVCHNLRSYPHQICALRIQTRPPSCGLQPDGSSKRLPSINDEKQNEQRREHSKLLKETLLLVFVFFLLVSLKQHLSGECFAAQTAASQDNQKRMEHQTQWQPLLQLNVATHRTHRLYATRTHKLLAALPNAAFMN